MPRPAIVIGVGGTGQWVLSWLKKDMLETYGSLEEQPVKLLLLDVASMEANVGKAATTSANAREGGSYTRYAGVDPNREFIQLPTDKSIEKMRQIDDGVADGESSFDHIANWYCGNYYPRDITLSDGAGKFRQLGRLSLVQGLHYQGGSDPLYATLTQMVNQVARPTVEGHSPVLDVHITGSLAGGSGSGMFIDIAWLLRKIIPASVQVTIMGFFALPTVFSSNASTDMRAKSFNAWRELNRIMTVGRNNTFEVRWGNKQDVIYDVDRPAYDHVYLVDRGPYNALNTEHPRDSIFPIMAEAISFYIDSHSGQTYVTNVRTNLNDRKTKHPLRGRPTFSTLYVRSWKLPIYHFNSLARHNFAKAYLDKLLEVESYSEVGPSGEQMVYYRLKNQSNCLSRAPEVLDANIPNLGNTQFLHELARIMRTHDMQRQGIFEEFSRRNLLEFYAKMPTTPEGQAIQTQLDRMTQYGPMYIDAGGTRDEIKYGLIRAEELLYGPNRQGGDYASLYGDFSQRASGDLYNGLEAVEQYQVNVLVDRVATWIERELNASNSQSGLACVKTALDRLEKYFVECIEFFEQIETSKPAPNVQEQRALGAFREAYQIADTTGPLGNFMGKIKRAVGDWYTEESGYNALQRDIRAVQRIINTLKVMRRFIQDVALDKVEAMEQQLVTDNNIDGVTGLYRGLLSSYTDEMDRHAYDRRLRQMMTLLGDDIDENDPRLRPDMNLVNQMVENTTWTIDDNLNVRVAVRLNAHETIELEASSRDPQQTRRLVERLIMGVADRVMMESDSTALDFIDLDNFEDELKQYNRTLFTQHGNVPSSEVVTFYLRAQANEGQRQRLETMVRDRLALNQNPPNSASVQTSENPNKVVMFRARELLLPEDFAEWHAGFVAYQQEVSGFRDRVNANFERIRCDHLFAAEKNALELENRYFQLDRVEFPILNFRLVHLLENRDLVVNFLQMWTLGWFYIQEGMVNSRGDTVSMWMWQTPRDNRANELLEWDEQDVLSAVERFVIGGNDFRGAPLPYPRMIQVLRDNLNQDWYNDPAKRTALAARYHAEVQIGQAYYTFLQTELDTSADRDELRKQLDAERDRIWDSIDLPEGVDEFPSFMEELAFDIARVSKDGNPVVSNVEGHMQGMNIMFAFLFDELGRHVTALANTKQDNNKDDGGDDGDGPRRRRRTR